MKMTKFKDVKIGNCVMGYDSEGIVVVGYVREKYEITLCVGESLEFTKTDKDKHLTINSRNRIHSDEDIYIINPHDELYRMF